MADTNFQPIFDYIDQTTAELKEDLKRELPSKEEIQRLQNTVETLAVKFDKIGQRTLVTENRLNSVEKWVVKAAEETNILYKP